MKPKRNPPLPGKLWIGTFEVPLRVVPPSHDALTDDDDGTQSNGMSVTDEDTIGIWIASNLPTRKRLEIVLHEITHLIDWAYGIDDDDGKTVTEEQVAEQHGKAWTQLYLDNPRFLKWLVFTVDKIRKDQKAHTDAEADEAPDHSGHPVQVGSPVGTSEVVGPVRGDQEA